MGQSFRVGMVSKARWTSTDTMKGRGWPLRSSFFQRAR